MKDELLRTWFAKKSWQPSEAALLLYGFDPEEWDGRAPKIECQEKIYRFTVGWGLSQKQIESLLHDLENDLEYEIAHIANTHIDNDRAYYVLPLQVAQWAWDVHQRFCFDENFLEYIQDSLNQIDCTNNTWIDRNYKKWAKMDSWNLEEAADLLSGHQPHREYELKSWHVSARKNECVELLKRLALTKRIDVQRVDDRVYFPAKEIVEWAQEKRFSIPPKLLEVMGFKSALKHNSPAKLGVRCEEWLKKSVKMPKEKSKKKYLQEAKNLFPDISVRAFNRAWDNATIGTDWQKAGRLKKQN